MNRDTLLIFPAIEAQAGANGTFVLTRKFVDGVLEYVDRWPGKVIVCVGRSKCGDTNLDHIEIDPSDVPFTLEWMPHANAELVRRIKSARVVLATLVDKHVDLAELCAAFQTPLVYIAEYSVLTRRQIIRAETHNPFLRWRREMWTTQLENQYVACVRRATGIQCNGTPTYEAYRQLNRRTLLYFDTRVRASQLANPELLKVRARELRAGAPLRLAFSGRLVAMKGVDHLPRVALELQRLGVNFTLEIFGGGEVEESITKSIHRMHLQDCVFTRGVLDFTTGLLPRMSRSVDLFVCCHRQGDPSCTYLETFSCGTPIVGYDNEALKGLVSLGNVGWTTPLDQPQLLAKRIADLNQRRDLLAHAAFSARRFAATHTFEETMQIRIDHLRGCTHALALEAKAS